MGDGAGALRPELEQECHDFFEQVDGDFPRRNKDLSSIITWKSSNTPVHREFRLPIPIELRGTVVDYRFSTQKHDVEFSVIFVTMEDGEPESEVVVHPRRVESHLNPIAGTFNLAKAGRLTLVWDNSYSWFANKVLEYSVMLHVPSLLATETAKCERAARALGRAARWGEEAAAAGVAAERARREAEAKAAALEAELERVHLALRQERGRAAAAEEEKARAEGRAVLARRQVTGLAFRVMMAGTLRHTMSFAGPRDPWALVCRDWHDAMQANRGERGSGAGPSR